MSDYFVPDRRAVIPQTFSLDKAARAVLKQQVPRCIWLTGLSGAGKSTIANLLEKRLHREGRHTYVLDGDNLRRGLCRDLGFAPRERDENIRRVSEVAKLMVDAGLIVIGAFISPFERERMRARRLFAEGEFVEVFVDASPQECERRDVKGLYARARGGQLLGFTGIDSEYERPTKPDLHLLTGQYSPEACVDAIRRYLSDLER